MRKTRGRWQIASRRAGFVRQRERGILARCWVAIVRLRFRGRGAGGLGYASLQNRLAKRIGLEPQLLGDLAA